MLNFTPINKTDAKVLLLNRDKKTQSLVCQVMVLIDDVVYVDVSSLISKTAAGKPGYLNIIKRLIQRHKTGYFKYYLYENTVLVPLYDFYEVINNLNMVFDVSLLSQIFQNTAVLIAYKHGFHLPTCIDIDLSKEHLLARYM